ncbi:MAG: hypothetical protein H6581_03920 [Bacteroidia bacterium]|nr:hypothetical protein [Bacteroidia bacterium]
MGRIGTYPTTYDDCRKITVSDLKNWGYLKATKSGKVTWNCNGEKTSSIGLESFVSSFGPEWIRLHYTTTFFNTGEKRTFDYKVYFDFIPSNLGISKRPYLICPVTGKRTLTLYSLPGIGKYAHRSANKLYYAKEIVSKHYREIEKTYGPIFLQKRLLEQLEAPQKWRKRHYQMRQTKWVRELTKRLKCLEGHISS